MTRKSHEGSNPSLSANRAAGSTTIKVCTSKHIIPMNPNSKIFLKKLFYIILTIVGIIVGLIILLFAGLFLLLNAKYIGYGPPADKTIQYPKPFNYAPLHTRGTVIYSNIPLEFYLTFPNDDWTLPAHDDTDPHFYENEACAAIPPHNCKGIEVQNHNELFAEGIDAAFTKYENEGKKPEKLPKLIPGAVVIKTLDYKYDVFFPELKRRYFILTNSSYLEETVVKNFKLIK